MSYCGVITAFFLQAAVNCQSEYSDITKEPFNITVLQKENTGAVGNPRVKSNYLYIYTAAF